LPQSSRRDGLVSVTSALAVRSCVPPLPAATIERPRLQAALDAHRDGAFTLVGAPPGWGKTVLLSGWAAERGAAWLTLGPRHADARRLWSDVCDALTRADVPLEDFEPRLAGRDDDVPLRLADALAGATERPTLVLDELDLLRGPALASLGELLAHGGDVLHVVAATRSDPQLPLERLRLSSRLGEIRAADLAFTLPEASAMLEELGVSLPPQLVSRLLERTEGWAAGLRLAGLSLRGEADPDAFVAEFAGDDRAVADYLTGEVLNGQPPATRELLLRTSIVGRVCGDLADALTGDSDGALLLERLERDGTFVVPLDRHRTWFRYHGLFAELLRARLRLEHPGLEGELHSRAAEWLAGAGLGREAMPHALAAEGPGSAPELVAEHWRELLLDGAAPAAVIAAADSGNGDPRLAVSAASACLSLGDAAGAAARLGELTDDGSDATRLGALLRARAEDDLVSARELSTALLRDTGPGRDGDALRALALFHHGAAEFEHGRLEVAAEQFEGAAAIAVDGEREGLLLGCLGRCAALELAEGALRRADTTARAALALAEPRGWHQTAPAAWAYAALAAVHWHRDELDDAERRADAAAAAAYASREADAVVATRALRAHLSAVHGDLVRARGLLRATHDALPGAGPLATRWLAALGPAPWAPGGPDGPVAEAADWLTRGDPLAALRRVEGLPEDDPALHPVLRLYAWLIAALAHHGLGRPDLASPALEQALALASSEGYRRPFVSGFPVRRLLERHLTRPTAYGPLVAELLDALALGGDAPPGLLEPLSERERAVLRLLPALLSNPEIAAELFVSVNTVKTHIKTIYRKLDVTSRRDAVVRARELRLI
jgi:LuxR family transcriptional regulator, maltose regulon positive regulatory protein